MGVARRESTSALVGISAVVGLLVVHAEWRGALGAARNDDWSYIRTAFDLHALGDLQLTGWASPGLIGQILPSWPVVAATGSSITALQLSVAVLGAVAAWVWYLVLRRVLSRALSICACTAVIAGPLFGSLAISFMTEVPTLLLLGVMTLCGLKANEGDHPASWFVGAAAAGVWAFTIREYVLGLFLAVAIFLVVRGRQRLAVLAVTTAALGLCASFWIWRHGLPFDYRIPVIAPTFDRSVDVVARAALTTGLLLAPAAFATSARRLVAAHPRSVLRATAVVVICLQISWPEPFSGNYLTRSGGYAAGLVAGPPAGEVHSAIWVVLTAVAAWSLILVLVLFGRAIAVFAQDPCQTTRDRPSENLLLMMTTAYLATLAVVAVMTPAFFDRYLLLLIPGFAGVALSAASTGSLIVVDRAKRWTIVACAGFVVFSAAAIDASASVDGARWRLGQGAVADGVPARFVDAGWEWFAFHQSGPVLSTSFDGDAFWLSWFSSAACVQVSTTTGDDRVVLDETRLVTPFLGSVELYLLEGPSPCPALTTR